MHCMGELSIFVCINVNDVMNATDVNVNVDVGVCSDPVASNVPIV